MTSRNYQLEISETANDPEWDAFVGSVESGHHVQTSLWGQVKIPLGWKPLRLFYKESERITMGLQALIRSYPGFGRVGYVTKGPVFLTEEEDRIDLLITRLIAESRLRKIRVMVVQPPNNAKFVMKILVQKGFQCTSLELAPTASILVDLSLSEVELLAQIHKSTRNNIRFGIKNGIKIHECSTDSLGYFYDLHVQTSLRQKFMPYKFEYYEHMQYILEPKGHFQILLVEYQEQIISGMLLIPFRDTVITKISGWTGEYEKLKPNDVLHWAVIQWAKNNGFRFVDLEGINRDCALCALKGDKFTEQDIPSKDKIKYKFGGKVTLYPEAYDYAFCPPYRLIFRSLNRTQHNNDLVSKILDILRKR